MELFLNLLKKKERKERGFWFLLSPCPGICDYILTASLLTSPHGGSQCLSEKGESGATGALKEGRWPRA